MNKNEYDELISKINYHMDLYYNQNETEISDYEYDMLMMELKKVENDHSEWITSNSPSQKIGGVAKREAGVKIKHEVPMLSIQDVFNKEDIIAWINKVHSIYPECTFAVETKIDGLSATLRYSKGNDDKLHLDVCETRGDGIIGEDVTANAFAIPDVKKIIDLPFDSLQIRGEIYMSRKDFEKHNKNQKLNGKKIAANPRNFAAGTLRQLDPKVTKERGLRMFIFNVQQGTEELTINHVQGLDILAKKSVPVVYHELCKTTDEVIGVIDKIATMRKSFDYDIDGVVIKINEIKYRNDFKFGSKYSSGHIAYKYPAEERIVVIDDIIVNVGRTGKLTFTANFHDKETGLPAKLGGTSVTKATLHNQAYINDKKIGIGGSYKLIKSGEIIPMLKECVEEPEKIFVAPTICPVCNSILVKKEDMVDIRCVNPNCHAQLSNTIAYFVSLNSMNIMGLGETIVDTLIRNDYLNSYADIYKLKEHRIELINKGIIGKEKNTDKILDAIEKSKKNDVERLLTGLAIRNVGKSTARDLMKHYSGIQELMNVTLEELISIDDIGEMTAKCIIEFFANLENRRIVRELEAAGVNMKVKQKQDVSELLSGLTFVVTGILPTLGRKEVSDIIEKNGGKCAGSVSKKTSFIVAGETAGSKLKKANELGINVIDEEALLDMIN